jgi:hypothetical protein
MVHDRPAMEAPHQNLNATFNNSSHSAQVRYVHLLSPRLTEVHGVLDATCETNRSGPQTWQPYDMMGSTKTSNVTVVRSSDSRGTRE